MFPALHFDHVSFWPLFFLFLSEFIFLVEEVECFVTTHFLGVGGVEPNIVVVTTEKR